MKRIIPLLIISILLLAGTPPDKPTQATSTTALNPEFMGIAIRDPWYDFATNPTYPNAPNQTFQDTMGTLLAQAGARWVRLEFHIPIGIGTPQETEAVNAEIAKYNYFITTVAPQHHLKILALLSFGLIPTDPCDLNKPTTTSARYGDGVNTYMETWLNRALTIADQFTTNIAAYEILNEENRLPNCATLATNGTSAIDITRTGRLITKLYRFCHNIPPIPIGEPTHGCAQAKIILGGIHPRGSSPPNNTNQIIMRDDQYLRAIYTDPLSFANFYTTYHYYPIDGIGYHPYPEEIQPSLADTRINARLPIIRSVLQSPDINDPYKPFWITEVGYNIAYYRNTLAGQEPFLRDVYTSLAARLLDNGQPEIANVFWFKYEDFPPASGADAQMWGLVRIPFTTGPCPGGACYDINGTPETIRPSFFAYRELAGLPVYRIFFPTTLKP